MIKDHIKKIFINFITIIFYVDVADKITWCNI